MRRIAVAAFMIFALVGLVWGTLGAETIITSGGSVLTGTIETGLPAAVSITDFRELVPPRLNRHAQFSSADRRLWTRAGALRTSQPKALVLLAVLLSHSRDGCPTARETVRHAGSPVWAS